MSDRTSVRLLVMKMSSRSSDCSGPSRLLVLQLRALLTPFVIIPLTPLHARACGCECVSLYETLSLFLLSLLSPLFSLMFLLPCLVLFSLALFFLTLFSLFSLSLSSFLSHTHTLSLSLSLSLSGSLLSCHSLVSLLSPLVSCSLVYCLSSHLIVSFLPLFLSGPSSIFSCLFALICS